MAKEIKINHNTEIVKQTPPINVKKYEKAMLEMHRKGRVQCQTKKS